MKHDVARIHSLKAQGLGLRRIAAEIEGLTPALAAYYMKFRPSACVTHGDSWSKDGTCLKCRQKARSHAANSALARKREDDAEFQAAFSETASRAALGLWSRDGYRSRMAESRQAAPLGRSSLNDSVAALLDRWGEPYVREAAFGPWNFDLLISDRKILVECQGEYWHSKTDRERMDRSKATYVRNHLPDYSLLVLWEVEFFKQGHLAFLLGKALGRNRAPSLPGGFGQLVIRPVAPAVARPLYDLYHYHGTARGGEHYGLFLGDRIVGACTLGPFLRQEQTSRYPDHLELARFVLDPDYQVPNLGSWFLSRVLRRHPRVVTYADTTLGHDGALYKACNFRFSHSVSPDYHYVDPAGAVMHKRTLWGRARKMSMTEAEYAAKHGMAKKWGGEKLCFIYP